MRILKQAAPVKLYGECGGCHTVVETDSAEATPLKQAPTWEFLVKCPVCNCTLSAFYKLVATDKSVYGPISHT
jgi:hypothetical protein